MGQLVVDGYNIIHAWPELAPLIRSNHGEEARRRLIATLGEYAAATGDDVTVVFDAHDRPRDVGRGERVDGVTVVFGSSTQTADHVIERRVAAAAARHEAGSVTVATSDRLQRDLVMGMGGAVIGAEALRAVVRGVNDELKGHRERGRRSARLGSRLEDSLEPDVRLRLEAMRRGRPPTGPDPGLYKP